MTLVPWTPPLMAGVGHSDALWNAFVSYAGHPVPLANGAAAAFALTDAPEGDGFCIALRASQGPALHVIWKAFPFNTLLGADFTVDDLPAVPVALRAALIEGMATLIWNAIPDRRLGEFKVGAIGPLAQVLEDGARANLAWFAVTVQNLAKESIAFTLGCERAALLDVLSADLAAPQKVHKSLKSQLMSEAFFTLAAVSVTISSLKSLAVGCVVVLPELNPEELTLRIADSEYSFRANADKWACLGVERRGRPQQQSAFGNPAFGNGVDTMAADAPEKQAPPSVSLASLPVVIDFDLGQTVVSLADLESWQAGSVVALSPPPRGEGAAVTLRANGQVIGTGDLVKIDDRLAVRISQLYLTT